MLISIRDKADNFFIKIIISRFIVSMQCYFSLKSPSCTGTKRIAPFNPTFSYNKCETINNINNNDDKIK